jgi:glutamate synthase (NADPH/NADH) large chain
MTGGRVVVLGQTGRNFAAGMSGGTAYVYRLDAGLVNRELVDLDPLSPADAQRVRELVEAHHAETGSARAADLLADWPNAVEQFTRVLPRDFARVRRIMAEAQASGADVDAAVMAVAGKPVPAAAGGGRSNA